MKRTTFTGRFGLISTAMAAMALLAAPEAKSQTSGVVDFEGDAFFLDNLNEPQRAPDYLDLTSGEVTLKDGFFIFHLTVAGQVPDEPYVARAGGGLIDWHWIIDIDPTTFPTGFPVPPGIPVPGECLVHISWDGTEFNAIFIDRRPSLEGQDPIVTDVMFNRAGDELSASVPESLLGEDLESFEWFEVADVFPGGYGSWSFTVADRSRVATWSR